MRMLIPAVRALMISAMVLFASLGTGPWQLCFDAEGQLQLKSYDADCGSVCTSDESGNGTGQPNAFGQPDGTECCTDFSLPQSFLHSRHRSVHVGWSLPTPASTQPLLALAGPVRVPPSRTSGPFGPNGPLTAHRTVVLRL